MKRKIRTAIILNKNLLKHYVFTVTFDQFKVKKMNICNHLLKKKVKGYINCLVSKILLKYSI